MKKWEILQNKILNIKNKKAKEDEIIKKLLENRGINGKKEIEEFLHPDLEILVKDELGIDKKEIKKAIKRIEKTIINKEPAVVYTDYDVDGICAGAIVWETLYGIGMDILPYVPDRFTEGYGLSQIGIDNVISKHHPTIIITVDHGITAVNEVEYARKKGIDVIIIDHHLPTDILPKSAAVVHSTKASAAGVAWVFCQILLNHFFAKGIKLDNDLKSKLDLVALATVADLVSLLGPNRTFIYHGLPTLKKTQRIGLKKLIQDAGLIRENITTYEIGHILAPRINATGRMTHAIDSLRLLCTPNEGKAMELARKLSFTNKERQSLTQKGAEYALNSEKVIRNKRQITGGTSTKVIVASSENYSQGVIGLIAGKLVEEYYLPSIVISIGHKYSKASARSISGFNIVESLKVSQYLESVGGHPMAAGFTILTENISKFKEEFEEIVDKTLDNELLIRVLKIDLELDLGEINMDFYNLIQKLSPFGAGNPVPVFGTRGVEVTGAKIIGKLQNHLKLTLVDNKKGKYFPAVAFGMSNIYHKLMDNRIIDIAYTIDLNEWNGTRKLQLNVKDVKFSS